MVRTLGTKEDKETEEHPPTDRKESQRGNLVHALENEPHKQRLQHKEHHKLELHHLAQALAQTDI